MRPNDVDGVPAGFDELCLRLHPRLVGSLRLLTGSNSAAEELAQETWVRCWERWSSVSAMPAPEAWVFRVATNLAFSRFRRIGAEARANARAVAGSHGDEADAADALVVRDALATLPARQRSVLVLRYYADLSVEQTATALRCAPGTVKSMTSKAIAGLRRRLGVIEVEVPVDA